MKKIKSFLYPILQKLHFLPFIIVFRICSLKRLREKKILMFTHARGELGGNLLQIKNYIEKNNIPFEIISYTSLNMPSKVRLASVAATSKFLMIDDFEPIAYVIPLRHNQELIQVWHGLGAFKKFGYSRKSAVKSSLTHKNYTKAIVSSENVVKFYSEAFSISKDKILPIGIPRTDLLFDSDYISYTKKRLYNKFPFIEGKKICLFAPTFRGENVNAGFYPESFFNPQKLADELGDDWIVITKYHPFIRNAEIYFSKNVVDMTNEREVNDVLLITDVLITDYSSVIFEGAMLDIPLVLYAPDLKQYFDKRGFYYDYNVYSYGIIVEHFDKLSDAVKNAKNDKKKLKDFKNKFINCCDGHSTERFVKRILQD